ncbi:lebercilin [Carcharodon carcharias]|uniref:lebercilin n=1 Tax=Carcharodon carcharias TaxID=13397 RepID=UPI001B7E122F|nr:lebercilin [Carcharodon carcharias]
MESQNGYFDEDITVDSETERILHSGRASTRRKLVTNGNNSCIDKEKKIKPPQSSENTMRDQEKTKKNMDYDKNSDSYYSDDYDDSSYTSEQYCSEISKSRTPSPRKKRQAKQRFGNPCHNQANGKSGSRQTANHGSRCWGSRTQSLNKESVHKEVDLVTKRMLSARLLKINELRNEVTELQAKLEDLQKENKILKRLQYRQERALNKFEDTENEISLLISHHNDEVRVLRERLRKSKEKERALEKRLKDTEEELFRTRSSLQKLKKLSEDKHLVERDELAQKLAKAEIKMEESERKLKELEKNLELSNHSLLRQVTSERKKTHVAQENVQNLQETIQHLNSKLKEKEKELDVKNIYANRILKASPKKDTESVSKKKATVPNTVKGVQTEEYYLPLEFPTPPPAFSGEEELRKKGEYSQKTQEHHDCETLEWTDCPRRDKELKEYERDCEEALKREHEQHRLELKAQKLKEKWEREEQERKREEKERREKETNTREVEHKNLEKVDERRKKDILLAKMREIDEEANGRPLLSPHQNTEHPFSTEMSKSQDSPERLQKTSNFLKSVENTPTESYGRRSTRTTDFSDELSFGTYAPSFGKGTGRSGPIDQKGSGKDEQMNGHYDFPFKDRKSNLMDQLFGSGAATGFTSKEENFVISPVVDKSKRDNNPFPWDKTSIPTKKTDHGDSSSSDDIISSNHHCSKYTSIKPAVKAIDSLEDEIEEVVL